MSQIPLAQTQNAPDTFPRARIYEPADVVYVPTSDIEWALSTLAAHRHEYDLYAAYMRGDHRLVFATSEYRAAFKQLLEGLRCNIAPAVVYALTDRLEVEGFDVHDTEDEAIGQQAWNLWQDLNMDHLSGQVHDETVSMGDAFLLIWPDIEGKPRPYLHTALEMVHKHDPERPEIITLAAKMWRDGKRYRLNLYYDNRIERYTTADLTQTPTKASQFMLLDDQPEIPNPYGQVPVFHFTFDSSAHGHGTSEIKDVIPIQDALNASLHHLVTAGEFVAYPQRYALGIEPDVDEKGNALPLPLNVGIDRLITVANPDVKMGQFEAANLETYTKVIDLWYAIVARNKGIPLSYFFMTGDQPSGEALKTAESRLTKRVHKTSRSFGISWAQAMSFALRVAGGPDQAHLVTKWQAPESRNDLALAQTIAVKVNDLGISKQQAWREAGYSEAEIAQMLTEKDTERVTVTTSGMGVIDAGRVE